MPAESRRFEQGNSLSQPGADRAWYYAAVGALLIAGPLARDLYYTRYPLFSAEAVALLLGLAAGGAGLMLAALRLGRPLIDLAFAALLFLFLDLQFDLHAVVSYKLLGIGCLLLSLVLRRRRATIAGLALGAFYLTSLPIRSHDRTGAKISSL